MNCQGHYLAYVPGGPSSSWALCRGLDFSIMQLESMTFSFNVLPSVFFQFNSCKSLVHVQLFATSWTAARQPSLSITNSRSLLKVMSIKSVMPSNHLILCCPFFLLPSIFPSIRVFSNEWAVRIRWPEY